MKINLKILSLVIFLNFFPTNAMHQARPEKVFQEKIDQLLSQKESELKSKKIEKKNKYKIWIDDEEGLLRDSKFESSGQAGAGSYIVRGEYLIKSSSGNNFFQYWSGNNHKKITKFALSLNDTFLVAVAEKNPFLGSSRKSDLIGLELVNLDTKEIELIPLPKEIPVTYFKTNNMQQVLEYINKGYSLEEIINGEYLLDNGRISAFAVSNDGKKIALANNTLICLMEKKVTDNTDKKPGAWITKLLKEIKATEIVTGLKPGLNTSTLVYWPQKVAFLCFNENADKLAVGYYDKNPKPLSWSQIKALSTTDKTLNQEAEIITL